MTAPSLEERILAFFDAHDRRHPGTDTIVRAAAEAFPEVSAHDVYQTILQLAYERLLQLSKTAPGVAHNLGYVRITERRRAMAKGAAMGRPLSR